MGKGLVGRLTFDGVQFDVLHHHEFWPTNLDTMTEHEWTRFDADRRGGRSLAEARTLDYGSVVGVPLVDPDTLAKRWVV